MGELQRLITMYEPICICLQHVGTEDLKIKDYQLVSKNQCTDNELGTAIYIHYSITHDNLPVNSPQLQYSSTTLCIAGKEKINICNIYNQPQFNYNFEDLNRIITSAVGRRT